MSMHCCFEVLARFVVGQAGLIVYLFVGALLVRRCRLGKTDAPVEEMRSAFSAACAAGAVALVLHYSHYVYAGMLISHAVVPIILAYPLARRLLASVRNVLLVLVPFTLSFVTLIQLRCTSLANCQWFYDFSLDNRYLYVIETGVGTLGGLLAAVGTQSQMAEEFVFYVCFVPGTLCVFLLFREVMPSSLRHPSITLACRAFFPLLFGLAATELLSGIAWYVVARRGTAPWHAVSASIPYVLGWVAWLRSRSVRNLTKSPLFILASVLSLLWTALWELGCGGMARLWLYQPANTLTGWVPWMPNLSFPAGELLGIPGGLAWAVEEWIAYPQLFTFVFVLLDWLHEEGLRIWSRPV